MMNIVQNLKQI